MQKVVRGEGFFNDIGTELSKTRHSSVFLITGRHFPLHDYRDAFGDLEVFHYIKQGSNVAKDEINAALTAYQEKKSGVILAVGGGSVIDLGKGIMHALTNRSVPLPFFAVAPTTSGSGSEATSFAVVYDNGRKQSLVNSSLLPELVLLDPTLTYSLTPYQTAVSGMDAVAQSVESWWSRNATRESKIFSERAINLWKENFLPSIKRPDPRSRKAMMNAAYAAGQAISITRTTGPHALSYYLTANHDVPHGQAVGIFLPVFFLYNKHCDDLFEKLEVEDAEEARRYIDNMMSGAGLATRLSELNIKKETVIEKLLHEVNEERFANNPEPFDRDKLKKLLLLHL